MQTDRRPATRKVARAGADGAAKPGDFASYVSRNVAPAYRLASIALDDPVSAQDVVHDALMAAWQAGATWPAGALDAAFGRRLVGEIRRTVHLRAPGVGAPQAGEPAAGATEHATDTAEHAPGATEHATDDATAAGLEHGDWTGNAAASDRLTAAVAKLPADDAMILAERLVLPGEIEPVTNTLRGRGSLDRRVAPILSIVAAHAGWPAGERDGLEAELRSLLESRDPVSEPSQLRWRLQRSLIEAEQAVAEQEEIAATSGWGFAIKFIAALLVGVLAISVVSISAVRQNATATDLAASPLSALVPARVTVLSPPLGSGTAHVAATNGALIALLESPQLTHSSRGCPRDVLGLVGDGGGVQWIGDLGAHVDSVAGDAGSTRAFIVGRDDFCNPLELTSTDGGHNWSAPAAAKGNAGGVAGGAARRSAASAAPPAMPDQPGAAATADAAHAGGVAIGSTLPSLTDWVSLDPAHPGTVLMESPDGIWVSPDGMSWHLTSRTVHPVGFDGSGRLIGWSDGRLAASYDDGVTWFDTSTGPSSRPSAGAALVSGALLAGPDGLWWYPYSGEPGLVQPGRILAVSALADGAVAAGVDAQGKVWIGTVNGGVLTTAILPAGLDSVDPKTAEIAVNDSGALVAFEGSQPTIVFVAFDR